MSTEQQQTTTEEQERERQQHAEAMVKAQANTRDKHLYELQQDLARAQRSNGQLADERQLLAERVADLERQVKRLQDEQNELIAFSEEREQQLMTRVRELEGQLTKPADSLEGQFRNALSRISYALGMYGTPNLATEVPAAVERVVAQVGFGEIVAAVSVYEVAQDVVGHDANGSPVASGSEK